VAHKAATGKQGTVYTNTSTIGSIPTSEPFYWWAAEWTGNAGTEPSGCVACQYASNNSYDSSTVFSDSWPPSAAPAPPTPAPAATSYTVKANAPGRWQGMLVASGTAPNGSSQHTSSNDGRVWVSPRSTPVPPPQDKPGNLYSSTGLIPGSWKPGSTLTVNGYAYGNVWHTTTTNGASWTTPVMVSKPKPPVVWSATTWAYAAPAGLTARGGKTSVFLAWDNVTATSPAFPAGKKAPAVGSYTVKIGNVTRTATTNSIQVGSLPAGNHVAEVWANGGPVGPPHASVTFRTEG
jgi:hypothetical protein